ncbi:hypothetical protein F2P81_019905 [Scophthalmus maximus]|uniref:Uncharacterized protein n=1 Tax=Scophthalmus maximus TaxID=52904 RepID=A0A6A4S929_SCOMX|nr:hypothetical protein F2P81_019905 [Scophthalmus maximus]
MVGSSYWTDKAATDIAQVYERYPQLARSKTDSKLGVVLLMKLKQQPTVGPDCGLLFLLPVRSDLLSVLT